jgi:hypothetical protein
VITDELSLVTPTWSGGKPVEARRGFAINGRPLAELIEIRDNICVLDLQPDVQRAYVKQLLMRAPSAFTSGRVPLYVCSLCADIGCGTISVRVAEADDCIVWSELSYESPWEASPAAWNDETWDRPFYFAREQYRGVIY